MRRCSPFSKWTTLSHGRPTNATNSPARSADRRRLSCEPLEDRRLLSVFVVEGTGDAHLQPGAMFSNPIAGQPDTYALPSLRAAVEAADQNPGADTITFDPSLAGQTITLSNGQLELSDTTGKTTITGLGANQLTIDGNSASRVFQVDTGVTADIAGLTISQGQTPQNGGGILNWGTLSVTDCTLSQNTAQLGGGIYNDWFATVTITDSTISGNSAQVNGGGIFNQENAMLTLADCTVSGNSAQSDGGGIYNASGTATLGNTIVAANTCTGSPDADISGAATANYCLIGNATGATFSSSSANNITGVDPLLGPLGNYGGPTETIPLLPGSPAIGAADPASSTAQDQRGITRDAKPDIGAFESQGFTISISGGNNQQTPIGTQFANPLAVEVTSNFGEPVTGGQVTFTPPATGASATFSGGSNTATIDSGGSAQVVATANDTLGPYTVGAAAVGATGPASFNLGNVETPSLVVNTANDIVNPYDEVTSLREAIAYANTHPGDDTITFAPSLAGQTIKLANGELELTDTTGKTTITGLGANQLIIDGNSASGVFQVDAGVTADISGLTISHGSSSGDGGAIDNLGTLSVTDCTLSQNSATDGGGIYNDTDGTATVADSTFSGNSAAQGGGIYNMGTLALADCTLSGNSAQSDGGGICNASGTATLGNTIVAGNTCSGSPDISGAATANYCLIGDPTGTQFGGSSANNITRVDPLLGPLGNYGGPSETLPLLPGSPAIDAGNNSLALDASGNPLTTDQRGVNRVVNGTVDIGAFESQGFTISIVGGNNQEAAVGTQFANPLAVEVASNFGEPVAGGQVTFTPPATGASATFSGGSNIATIDSSGQAGVQPQANSIVGGYTVTASARGAAPSAAFALTNSDKIVQSITFSHLSDLTYGVLPITLAATATSGLPVTFTVISGPATLSGDSLSVTGAGAVVVEADQAGNQTHLSATPVQQKFNVAQATQTIQWSNPADIVYGTALGAGQLNATVSVVGPAAAGAITYTPAAGTVLDAGQAQTLTVSVAGTTDYKPATASVLINVAPAPLTITADSQYMPIGGPMPALTFTCSGLVNGDTSASLTTQPTVSTTATATSPVARTPSRSREPRTRTM